MSLEKSGDGRMYTLASQPPYPTRSVKNLGVLTRFDLTSLDNTNNIYGNGLHMFWARKRSFCIWSEEIATRLFSSMITSMLKYGSPAYCPITRAEV